MKTRQGYVSNSSSTSFIVYGKELDYYDALEAMKDESNNVICILHHKGTSGECEDFVFRMTDYRMKALKKGEKSLRKNMIDIENGKFLLIMKEWFNDGGVMDITEPLTGGRIYEVRKDDSSPTTDSNRDRNFAKWMKLRGE